MDFENIEISDLPVTSMDVASGQDCAKAIQQDQQNKRNGFFNTPKFKKWRFVLLMTIEGWIEFLISFILTVWLLKEGKYFLGLLLIFVQIFPSVFLVIKYFLSDRKYGTGRILLSTYFGQLTLLPWFAIYYSSRFGYLKQIKQVRNLQREFLGSSLILVIVSLIANGQIRIPLAYSGIVYSNDNATADCGLWPFAAILYFGLNSFRSFPLKPITLELKRTWIAIALAGSVLLFRISAFSVLICVCKEYSLAIICAIILFNGLFYWRQCGSDAVYSFFSILHPPSQIYAENAQNSYLQFIGSILIGNITLLASLFIVYILYYLEEFNPWCRTDLQRIQLEEEWFQKLTWLWIPLFATSFLPLAARIWIKRLKNQITILLLMSMYAFSLVALMLNKQDGIMLRIDGAVTTILNETSEIHHHNQWSNWEGSIDGIPIRFRSCSGILLQQLDERINKDEDVLTEFENAIRSDKYFKIRPLIKTGVAVNYKMSNETSTALASALNYKSIRAARVLIEQGADLNGLENQIALAFNKTFQGPESVNTDTKSFRRSSDFICNDPYTDDQIKAKEFMSSVLHAIGLPLALTGIVLNTLAIITFTRLEMATFFTKMLACLALFDTGFLVLQIIEDLDKLFGPLFYHYKYFSVYFKNPFKDVFILSSIYMTAAISFERLRAVVWPVHYKTNTKSRLEKLNLATSAFAVVTVFAIYCLPKFFACGVLEKEVNGTKTLEKVASDFSKSHFYTYWYNWIVDIFVWLFLPPFLLITINLKIFLVISKKTFKSSVNQKSISLLFGIVILHNLTQIPWTLNFFLYHSMAATVQMSFKNGCSNHFPFYLDFFWLHPFLANIINASSNFFIYYYSNTSFRAFLKNKFGH